MLENLNIWELGALVLLALFIFGPERLPKVISDGVRLLRNVRNMARNATSDLSRELGTEVNLEDLHPKTFIRKHVLSEEDERLLRRPFEDAYRDVQGIAADANDYARPTRSELPPGSSERDHGQSGYDRPRDGQPSRGEAGSAGRYDSDAT
ncbi:MAG TPA: Sec-independent protein translocase subunit TatB [Micromonosporaceae bacterium]